MKAVQTVNPKPEPLVATVPDELFQGSRQVHVGKRDWNGYAVEVTGAVRFQYRDSYGRLAPISADHGTLVFVPNVPVEKIDH